MNLEAETDENLARFIQKNNGRGIDVFIDRYQKPLLRYTTRLIGDADVAEDAVQNTFISAYQNINSYNPNRPFSPWIYRIAHNKAINEIRSKKPHVEISEIPEIADEGAEKISDTLDRKSLKKYLDEYVNSLPLKYRDAIILRFFEDKSYEEISDVLQIPVNTVGVRLRRGLDKLKLKNKLKLEDY